MKMNKSNNCMALEGILIAEIAREKASHKTLEGIATAKMSSNTWVGIFIPKLTR